MNVKLARKKAADVRADLVVLPVLEGKETAGVAKELGADDRRLIEARVRRTDFKGRADKTLSVQAPTGDLLLIGVAEDATAEGWRRLGGRVRKLADGTRAKTVAVCLGSRKSAAGHVLPLVEGFRLAGYSFAKYKSKRDDDARGPRTLTIAGNAVATDRAAKAALGEALAVCDATCLARDLVNETPSVKTPRFLATQARRIVRGTSLTCEVWTEARLEKERMRGILAVSKGSVEPGRLIKITYKPRGKAKGKVAVVGKGITFDSGGLSLKPGKAMETMKLDMSGAAAVLGLMKALAVVKPAVEVTGYIAAAENMPSGTAQKPGDVIEFRNGTTAEVLNTDAEGRLVLADALCLAAESKPDCMIDLATLTGACMVALGTRVAGIMGNDDELADRLIEHGRSAGESLWRLPLVEDYAADIRSKVADIKNIGAPYGGTITAALFLRHFVGEVKWAHLDIAGPAFTDGAGAYQTAGGSGFGVRTLVSYIKSLG